MRKASISQGSACSQSCQDAACAFLLSSRPLPGWAMGALLAVPQKLQHDLGHCRDSQQGPGRVSDLASPWDTWKIHHSGVCGSLQQLLFTVAQGPGVVPAVFTPVPEPRPVKWR